MTFDEFADFTLNFRLLVWLSKPRRHPAVRSQINYNIHRLFKENNIEIPFPRRDVYMHHDTGANGLEYDDLADEEEFAAPQSKRRQ